MKNITIKKGESLKNTSLDVFIENLDEREGFNNATEMILDHIKGLAIAINKDLKKLSELHIEISE
jgi:hypothetical protein